MFEKCRPSAVALNFYSKDTLRASMFDKQSLDNLFDELRDQYELEPEWEDIQRAAHLGVARSDAGVPLGDIDGRVVAVIEKHRPD